MVLRLRHGRDPHRIRNEARIHARGGGDDRRAASPRQVPRRTRCPSTASSRSTSTPLSSLGAPLYMGRWHRDARAFLRRHRDALAKRPLAVFALGPVKDEPKQWDGAEKQLYATLAQLPGHRARDRRAVRRRDRARDAALPVLARPGGRPPRLGRDRGMGGSAARGARAGCARRLSWLDRGIEVLLLPGRQTPQSERDAWSIASRPGVRSFFVPR